MAFERLRAYSTRNDINQEFMVMREKSKEALAVASTVTHFTEIVAAHSTGRYMYNGSAIRGTRLHVHAGNALYVSESS